MAAPSVLADQQRFRTLLQALSRPGRILALQPALGNGAPVVRYPLAIAETLLDHEVSFAVAGTGLHPLDAQLFGREVRLRTGSRSTAADSAGFVFLFGPAGAALKDLRTGDPLFPDRGATVVWSVQGFDAGIGLSLAGPGIDGRLELFISGVSEEDLVTLSEVNSAYPLGIDVLFVTLDGRIAGLPRSTGVSVLPAARNGACTPSHGAD